MTSFVEEIVNTVVNYRKQNDITQNDFMQVLLKNREKSLSDINPNDKDAQGNHSLTD